jgi:hypothetical protein
MKLTIRIESEYKVNNVNVGSPKNGLALAQELLSSDRTKTLIFLRLRTLLTRIHFAMDLLRL